MAVSSCLAVAPGLGLEINIVIGSDAVILDLPLAVQTEEDRALPAPRARYIDRKGNRECSIHDIPGPPSYGR